MVEAEGKLVRSTAWAGLRPGDAVAIDLPRERRQHFEFVAHVRNLETDDEWVEVRGGRTGERKDRAFKTQLVFPANARRGGTLDGPSLESAPRLPFN